MNDHFTPPGASTVAAWIARELEASDSIFGIPRSLWFRPSPDDRLATSCHGHRIGTPIGVAAGPHTQMAQNIVTAWLCGARVFELKTVQQLDAIDVAKPCIDMQDEGTNTEWSQELTVQQSFREYLLAWVLIHTLNARFRLADGDPAILFDLSVGYDLDGITSAKMQWYLEHAADAGGELDECVAAVAEHLPEVRDVVIPRRLSDCVTLSTLHGCPPGEIGAIAEHLMTRWGLHTAVKLNPTLTGYDDVRRFLVDELGWTHIEPHRPAFDADIAFPDAEALVKRMTDVAADCGVDFGLKLCNTLPAVNRRSSLAGGGPASYLSGRPLHLLAVELARRFRDAAGPLLSISFAGGADAFNTPRLLATGLHPVTVCSDILRPGGYLRLPQYLEEIGTALDRTGAADLTELALHEAGGETAIPEAWRTNLDRYADELRGHPELAAWSYRRDHTKTDRPLGFFDCIAAPCTDACGVDQDAPGYLRRAAVGDVEGAARIIARDNPLPSVLGRACHHPCEDVCVRTHLDRPVAIREIKRFVTDHAATGLTCTPERVEAGFRVAVVGAGPCGLAAATDLVRAGVETTVVEARADGGGMVSDTIPGYRAADAIVHRDLDALRRLGVEIIPDTRIGVDLSLDELIDRGYRHVIVAVGAQRGVALGLDGDDADGVLDGLEFLRLARRGDAPALGRHIGVIGGGDVAMDCARTARRLTNNDVQILYRRTTDEMPAHPDEVRDLLAEGCTIRELVSPLRIGTAGGRLASVECAVMTLGDVDESGRPRPRPMPGETVTFELDTLIVAIGQRADLAVFGDRRLTVDDSGFVDVDPDTLETSIPGIWVGGDLRHPGPSNIVEACGDGRRIARGILEREGLPAPVCGADIAPPELDPVDVLRRRSRRIPRVAVSRVPAADRSGFAEVLQTLPREAARAEAARCLDCDLVCATCVSVCPNRAFVSYRLDLEPGRPFEPGQRDQVAVINDLCNHCGNCTTFCPTAGRPWQDKPRLCLDRGDFEAEADNAFMLLDVNGARAIQGRFGGALHQLIAAGQLVVTRSGATARLDPSTFQPAEDSPNIDDELLHRCGIMWTLLRGVTGSLPHFPLITAERAWLI